MSDVIPVERDPFPMLLPRHEIHIWCVTGEDLDDAAALRRAEMELDPSEIARAAKFLRPADRHRFITSRGMLRRVLGVYLRTAPREIVFSTNDYGRPELAGPVQAPVRFNLSHTDGFVAGAFTWDTEIGIDAEHIRSEHSDLQVARRHFPVSAYRDLDNMPEGCRPTRFCEYWVLMEAYAKARGRGLSLPLRDSVFAFERSDRSMIRFAATSGAPQPHWRFWLMAPSPDHRMAVAAAGDARQVVIRRLGPDGASPMAFPFVASSEELR